MYVVMLSSRRDQVISFSRSAAFCACLAACAINAALNLAQFAKRQTFFVTEVEPKEDEGLVLPTVTNHDQLYRDLLLYRHSTF